MRLNPSANPQGLIPLKNPPTAAFLAWLFPGLGPVTQTQSTGESSYHGLQVFLSRRFANRLAYQASYTWGHAISNVPLTAYTTQTSDPFNPELDRGDADLDRRHTFVGNIVYELPGFEGLGEVGNNILGGWQINGIFSAYSGQPIDVFTDANAAGTSGGPQRPDPVPGVSFYLDNDNDATTWLNPAAFQLPAEGTFGSLARGSVRSPKLVNLDVSISKNWRFGERYGLQFRAELFNAFNHPNFVGWVANLGLQNNINDPNFGRPTNGAFGTLNAAQAPREIQFGLKFLF